MERENGGPLISINKVVESTAAALKVGRTAVINTGKEQNEKLNAHSDLSNLNSEPPSPRKV